LSPFVIFGALILFISSNRISLNDRAAPTMGPRYALGALEMYVFVLYVMDICDGK